MDQREMPAPSLPAASLRPPSLLPARGALLGESNHLIRHALWSIRVAILWAASNFLPALREGRRADEGQWTGKSRVVGQFSRMSPPSGHRKVTSVRRGIMPTLSRHNR